MNATVAEQRISRLDAPPETGRMLSLDVFRGLTIATMILVNNPGSWSHVYSPLRHAEWNGWTPTDLVFPFFLFIVGIAIPLSLGRKAETSPRALRLLPRIVRRSAVLFALGLMLAGFPFFDLSTLRIPGVLQRIAVCYLVAAIIFLMTGIRGQAIMAALLLAGYWALITLVPVPADHIADVAGRGGSIEKEANLAAYIDNLLLGGHLWRQTRTWDPEGLLSTLPAIATVLLGMLAGHWLKSDRPLKTKIYGMIIGGVTGVIAGQVWNLWFPINKNLWTSSYVVFSAGMALLLLALCYWLVDFRGYKRPAAPFIIFGVNAIAVYVLSGLVARLLGLIKVGALSANGTPKSLQAYIYETCFASWAGPLNGSLLYALAFVLLMFLPMLVLYRKRIFIKA